MNNLKGLSERTKADIMSMSIVEVYQEGYEAGKSSTSSVEVVQETVEHDGLVLRKVNRRVSEGHYVRFHNTKYNSRLKDGVIYGPVRRTMTIDDYNVFNDYHNRTLNNVEVFEVVGRAGLVQAKDAIGVRKSPNQQRAELIQRAREFVEGLMYEGQDNVGKVVNGYAGDNKVKFVVNNQKRVVVALLKLAYILTRKLRGKGIAKCKPGEVFNADIGKAIALARALEIDVPEEFLQAVQPDKAVVGMIVQYLNKSYEIVLDNVCTFRTPNAAHRTSVIGRDGTITDDTNAIYEEVGG